MPSPWTFLPLVLYLLPLAAAVEVVYRDEPVNRHNLVGRQGAFPPFGGAPLRDPVPVGPFVNRLWRPDFRNDMASDGETATGTVSLSTTGTAPPSTFISTTGTAPPSTFISTTGTGPPSTFITSTGIYTNSTSTPCETDSTSTPTSTPCETDSPPSPTSTPCTTNSFPTLTLTSTPCETDLSPIPSSTTTICPTDPPEPSPPLTTSSPACSCPTSADSTSTEPIVTEAPTCDDIDGTFENGVLPPWFISDQFTADSHIVNVPAGNAEYSFAMIPAQGDYAQVFLNQYLPNCGSPPPLINMTVRFQYQFTGASRGCSIRPRVNRDPSTYLGRVTDDGAFPGEWQSFEGETIEVQMTSDPLFTIEMSCTVDMAHEPAILITDISVY